MTRNIWEQTWFALTDSEVVAEAAKMAKAMRPSQKVLETQKWVSDVLTEND